MTKWNDGTHRPYATIPLRCTETPRCHQHNADRGWFRHRAVLKVIDAERVGRSRHLDVDRPEEAALLHRARERQVAVVDRLDRVDQFTVGVERLEQREVVLPSLRPRDRRVRRQRDEDGFVEVEADRRALRGLLHRPEFGAVLPLTVDRAVVSVHRVCAHA